MTALLWFLVFEIPITAAVVLLVMHQVIITSQEVMARVIGRRLSDLTFVLEKAEERISEAARTGARARSGPARLRDYSSGSEDAR